MVQKITLRRIAVALLWTVLCLPCSAFAQQLSGLPDYGKRPKLVVGIVVDQMRYDYLVRFRDKFSAHGFNRLLQEGFSCENASYNYVPTYTAPGHACIYTGTTPALNGIVGNDWYDRESKTKKYCVKDANVKTVGSTTVEAGRMSPRNLLTTTITDELQLATNFKSKVIGIALKDRGSVLPAGHDTINTTAFWYDTTSGNWITSSYYRNDLPEWVKSFNKEHLPNYLSKPWTLMRPNDPYAESTTDLTLYEEPYVRDANKSVVFPHNFPAFRNGSFRYVMECPEGNTVTKDFALAALKNENMGKGDFTDFLAVSFSATDYIGHQFGINSMELEDTYLRLDSDLAVLLTYLDNNYGKDNVLVFLTADHGASQNPAYMTDRKMPGGFIVPEEMDAYIKAGLKKRFNVDRLVSSFINSQVYLDQNRIDSIRMDAIKRNVANDTLRNLTLEVVSEAAAELLLTHEGVAGTMTAAELENSNHMNSLSAMVQKGYHKPRSGDVMVILAPGYIEREKKTGTTHGSGYSYDTHVPLLWYGWQVPKGVSAQNVSITDIAATLAAMLHLEFPNGCIGKPIDVLVK